MFFAAFALMSVTYGSGQHIWDIPPENVPIGLKVSLSLLVSFSENWWPILLISRGRAV